VCRGVASTCSKVRQRRSDTPKIQHFLDIRYITREVTLTPLQHSVSPSDPLRLASRVLHPDPRWAAVDTAPFSTSLVGAHAMKCLALQTASSRGAPCLRAPAPAARISFSSGDCSPHAPPRLAGVLTVNGVYWGSFYRSAPSTPFAQVAFSKISNSHANATEGGRKPQGAQHAPLSPQADPPRRQNLAVTRTVDAHLRLPCSSQVPWCDHL